MAEVTNRAISLLKYGAALSVILSGTQAFAAEDRISGSAGASYNSHFISYGLDVWGGGDEFFGDRSTTFVWSDIGVDLEPFSINVGVWADINNNAPESIGGSIQEIDWYVALGYTYERLSLGFAYQQWNYASDVEEIIDLSVSFDDSGLLPIALNPSLIWHFRTEGNGGQQTGSALVLSVAPGFALNEGADYEVSVSFPLNVAFFLDDDFQGGTEGGYAYTSFGAGVSVPLAFIDSSYGDWSLGADLLFYATEADAIPGNPDENFLTGAISLSVAF